jgi:hypothetical protein
MNGFWKPICLKNLILTQKNVVSHFENTEIFLPQMNTNKHSKTYICVHLWPD